ncbi:hypothetical protein O181_043559 [Austropuccinia psidii MF-1]|uniref:Uncharacterized protein n=1 Tax=Austropuccinia psidii MF-1 TaxID=1389203 RepID=A0A9Q3HIJ3_9BASI|nr:hypothetical protein [Austropuccinia psidii MF-1]
MLQNTEKAVTDVKKKTEPQERNLESLSKCKNQKYPWEIVHMDWVTALPPGGDRSYNAFLVLVDRYRKPPMFLPFNKDGTAMETAIMI